MVSSRGTLGCFLINSNGSNACIGTTQRRPVAHKRAFVQLFRWCFQYISTKDRSVLFVMRITSCGCTLKGRRAGGKVRSCSKCNKEQVKFLLKGNIDAFFIKTGFVCDHLYQCSLPVLFFFFGLLAKKSIPSGKNNPSSLSLGFH